MSPGYSDVKACEMVLTKLPLPFILRHEASAFFISRQAHNSCTSIAILSKMPSLAAAGLGIKVQPWELGHIAPIPFFPEQSLF